MSTGNNEAIMEKIEVQEQILDQVVKQVETLEKNERADLSKANSELWQSVQEVTAIVGTVKAFVNSLPKMMPVKHSLDIKDKWTIVVLITSIVSVALMVGWVISLYAANHRLTADSYKYRGIRQTFPKQADWADTTYRRDPEAFMRATETLEEESLASAHAKDISDQREREAQEARQKARVLSEQNEKSRKKALRK